MQDLVKKIRHTANIGLYGSIAVALIVTVLYHSKLSFHLNDPRWFVIGGVAIAVLVAASAILTVNRRPRQLRAIEGVEKRLEGYAAMTRSLYFISLFTNILLCFVVLISGDNTLLMFVLLLTLLLILAYPNKYRIKADLGLTHEQMHGIFGDDYHDDAPNLLGPNDDLKAEIREAEESRKEGLDEEVSKEEE